MHSENYPQKSTQKLILMELAPLKLKTIDLMRIEIQTVLIKASLHYEFQLFYQIFVKILIQKWGVGILQSKKNIILYSITSLVYHVSVGSKLQRNAS